MTRRAESTFAGKFPPRAARSGRGVTRADLAHERRLAWEQVLRLAGSRQVGRFQRLLVIGPDALTPAIYLAQTGCEVDVHLGEAEAATRHQSHAGALAGEGTCRVLGGAFDPHKLHARTYDMVLAVDPMVVLAEVRLSRLRECLRPGSLLIGAMVTDSLDLADLETFVMDLELRSTSLDRAMPDLIRQCPSIACARLRQAERRFLARLPKQRGARSITLLTGRARPDVGLAPHADAA